MSDKVSIVTILHGEKEFIPLITHNFNSFNKKEDLQLIIVDDGKDNLSKLFDHLDNCIYLHLDNEEIISFMDKIDKEYKDPDKSGLQYQRKCRTLPNGFKRDYGCGMSEHDYIFHMNADCVYNKKSIDRKLDFLKEVRAECTYCDTSLCYDIYGKSLYKTTSPTKIYESTLFHTREYWKRKGFRWSDIENEGRQFHFDNGIDRRLDNYYDTVQILSITNMNKYNPVKIELENIKIDIPELINEITIDTHPLEKYLEDLYDDNVSILGVNSDFLLHADKINWEKYNITEKWKQSKLVTKIKSHGDKFNVLLYNSNRVAWDIFTKIPFDIIFLETGKNLEQLESIILGSKTEEYIKMNGVFINKNFLK